MKKGPIIFIYTIVALYLIFFSRTEDLDIFTLGGDFIDYFKVFSLWTIIATSIYFGAKKIRKKEFSKIFFYSFWLIVLIGASINFQLIKFDPHPYDGPFDVWVHRDLLEKSRKQDSLNLADGYPDSTIMETNSIDTTKNGIYIWLNHKELFVRKHTTNFNPQRQEDSATMSIVRSWGKK